MCALCANEHVMLPACMSPANNAYSLACDANACDALVFAVRCRATRACVRDAAVSLLRLPVRKACYDAGLLGRGGVEKHMLLGVAVGRHCV